MVRFFGFIFPVFPLKSKNPTVLHVFTSFVLQVRVILLDSLTWFHKYLKESLSVTYVTKWNSYSIFQTDTGYSVVFFYNAAQGKNSEIRMFLGPPCLPAKMTPAQHFSTPTLYFSGELSSSCCWLLQSYPYPQLWIPAPSYFSASAICLILQNSHLLQKLSWQKSFLLWFSFLKWMGW